MSSRYPSSHERRLVWGCLCALALITLGCESGNDYYYLADIKGEGDTILLEFVYTCGLIDIGWGGGFGAPPNFQVDLTVKHDALGGDCNEDPREVTYDVGSIKTSFRAQEPSPTPLGLRVAPYEPEHGAVCLPDLFQLGPFTAGRCK